MWKAETQTTSSDADLGSLSPTDRDYSQLPQEAAIPQDTSRTVGPDQAGTLQVLEESTSDRRRVSFLPKLLTTMAAVAVSTGFTFPGATWADVQRTGSESRLPEVLDMSVDYSPNETGQLMSFSQVYQQVRQAVECVFARARYETFEDGMESTFEGEVMVLIERFRASAVSAIASLIRSGTYPEEVASMALRAVGQVRDPSTHSARLNLLLGSLSSPSLWIRDGALIGLAWLDEPAAVPVLEIAAEREEVPEIRRNICALIGELREA